MTTPACSNPKVDPDAFFPKPGEVIRNRPPARITQLARKYCATCPIVSECARHGATAHAEGLWGGTWRKKRNDTGQWLIVPILGEPVEVAA